MSEQWPAEGDLLNGRYRLIEPIGTGGMAVVWRARDESLERLVAIKVLNTDLAVDHRVRELVRREARTAAQLTHPQATPVYDYGEVSTPAGRPLAYVVMQLLEGEALDERLAAGPLPWADAARIGEQVARVLAATHGRGFIHGDISPGNIVLTPDGVRVIDFGIAETLVETGRPGIGGVFGTPPYVAPERLSGEPTQLASDVYAIGALLFEMFTGRPPHQATTWADADEARLRGSPPSLDGVPDLPADVAALCLRCLDPHPGNRPDASEVADRLAAALARESAARRNPKKRRRRFFGMWALIVSVALLSAALVVKCWPEAGPDHAPPAAVGGGADGSADAGSADAGSAGVGDGDGAAGDRAGSRAGADAEAGRSGTGPVAGTSALPEGASASGGVEIVTVEAAMSAVYGAIDNAAASSGITRGTADNLRTELRNLEANRTADADRTLRQIDNLRRKVSDSTRDGAITTGAARDLSAALDTLAVAVRQEPQAR